MSFKKKIMVILAAGIMAFSASFCYVSAATPAPAESATQEEQEQQQSQMDNSIAANAAAAAAAEQQQAQADQTVKEKKYLSRGAAAFWFIFMFILNGAFSFWVGNRFYRLARKDNHIGAEIRALRRDIDDKFVKSVGGFSEKEVDIENTNESLAMDDEGIKPKPKQATVRELSPEEEERFKRWEAAQAKSKTVKPRRRVGEVDDDFDSDDDDDFDAGTRRMKRKTYQPKRTRTESAQDDLYDDDDVDEELSSIRSSKSRGDGVKSKAREILGDIFPFKED